MSQAIAAAAGRWRVMLIALIVTGCASAADRPSQPAPPSPKAALDQVAEVDNTADERAPGPGGASDDAEPVQEAALRSGAEATTTARAPDVRLRTERTERGLLATLDLAFDPGSASIESGKMPLLTRLARLLREHPERSVLIEGHTDNTGTPTENLHLSLKRAEAVQEILIEQGIEPRRLILRGYGARRPVASNETEAGRQRNRRVEVVVLDESRAAAAPPREPGAGP